MPDFRCAKFQAAWRSAANKTAVAGSGLGKAWLPPKKSPTLLTRAAGENSLKVQLGLFRPRICPIHGCSATTIFKYSGISNQLILNILYLLKGIFRRLLVPGGPGEESWNRISRGGKNKKPVGKVPHGLAENSLEIF
jgi:hypothetical protein